MELAVASFLGTLVTEHLPRVIKALRTLGSDIVLNDCSHTTRRAFGAQVAVARDTFDMTLIDTPLETLRLTSPEPGLLVIELNRPQAANAFNTAMAGELLHVFAALEADPAVREILVVTHAPIFMEAVVRKPGNYEIRLGTPFKDLLEMAGGMREGRTLKAVIPGGSSMPPLDADELDVPIEFDTMMNDPRIKPVLIKPGVTLDLAPGRPLRTMAGSGGVVVMDEATDLVAVCARIMRFYAHESCGQCTPCREGSGWLAKVCSRLADNQGRPGDLDLLASKGRHINSGPAFVTKINIGKVDQYSGSYR